MFSNLGTFGVEFRIRYLLTEKDYNLSNWEYSFLQSIAITEFISTKQYDVLMEIWDKRKRKDIQSKDQKHINFWDEETDHLEMQAMYGYQF